jgi:hypothetical protein
LEVAVEAAKPVETAYKYIFPIFTGGREKLCEFIPSVPIRLFHAVPKEGKPGMGGSPGLKPGRTALWDFRI